MERIPARHESGKNLAFVMRAMSNDVTRPDMQCVRVRDGQALAVDGYRIHRAPIGNVPDGFYKPLKDGKEFVMAPAEINNFPDVESIIPTLPEDMRTGISMGQITNGREMSIAIARLFKAGVLVDATYLKELLVNPFDAFVTGPFKPILFKDDTKLAVLMPLNQHDV